MSDSLRSGVLSRKYPDPQVAHYYALQYSMFLPVFVCVLGGFFFLATAWVIEADRTRTHLVAQGIPSIVPRFCIGGGLWMLHLHPSKSTFYQKLEAMSHPPSLKFRAKEVHVWLCAIARLTFCALVLS